MDMKWYDWVAFILLIVGGLNWGLAIWDINLVTLIFGVGTILTKIVYGLVGVSAIYKLIAVFKD
jgi:uncharacterized membrane protein YuzA (DUF378 family)